MPGCGRTRRRGGPCGGRSPKRRDTAPCPEHALPVASCTRRPARGHRWRERQRAGGMNHMLMLIDGSPA
jgi:hypothetical protein